MKNYRKMESKAIIVVWTMVFLGFFVVIPSKTMAQKPEFLPIAAMGDFTGPYAPSTGPFSPGSEDAAKYVNEELGGIDGVKIKIESRDMKGNVALGLQQYAELIAMKPKPLLIGLGHTGMAEALREKVVADGLIGMTMASVGAVYPRGNMYGYAPLYPELLAVSLKWVKDNWKEDRKLRLGIITWDTAYGRSILIEEFFDYCNKIGVDIVGTELFKIGEVDVTTQMTRLRAKKPDWLATSTLISGPLSILKAAKEMGWKIKLVAGVALDWGTINLDPQLFEGCINSFSFASYDEPDHPGIKTLLKYMEKNKRGINERTGTYMMGWCAPLTMHKVIRNAVAKVGWSKLNPDAIKYEMDHLLDFEYLNGVGRLTYTKDIATTPWAGVYKIQGGKMISVNPGGGFVKVPDLRPAKFR